MASRKRKSTGPIPKNTKVPKLYHYEEINTFTNNKTLISKFEELLDQESNINKKDTWKKVVHILRHEIPYVITSGAQLLSMKKSLHLNGISHGTAKRVDEILETGDLKEIHNKL